MTTPPSRGRFRKKARPARRLHVRYRAGGLEPIGAYTKDIGADGAFLLTTAPLKAGTALDIEIDAPDGPITLKAEVRWVVELATAGEEAGMGVQFVSVDDAQRERLLTTLKAGTIQPPASG